jgi:hypothetical protein
MLRWFRSLFAWEDVRIKGCWLYRVNTVTGRRQAVQVIAANGPVDWYWLDAGNGQPLINGFPAWRSAVGQISGRYY